MVELGAGGASASLALEALEVLLSPVDSKQVLPLLMPELTVMERLDRLSPPADDRPTDLIAWLQDIIEDAEGRVAVSLAPRLRDPRREGSRRARSDGPGRSSRTWRPDHR